MCREWDNNYILIQPAVFKRHTDTLLRYLLPGSNSQRHFPKTAMTLRVPLYVYRRREEWIQAGCDTPKSLSLPSPIAFIHPSVCKHALEMFLWQSWETRLCRHQTLPMKRLKWETNGTWCTLDPSLEMDLSHVSLYRTRSARLLSCGAWCKECILRYRFLIQNGKMLLFFILTDKNYCFTCSLYGLYVLGQRGGVSSLSSGTFTKRGHTNHSFILLSCMRFSKENCKIGYSTVFS